LLKKNSGLKHGYNSITNLNDLDWNNSNNSQMNFGILQMTLGDNYFLNNELEKAILLMQGTVTLTWNDRSSVINRNSFFNDNPTVLLVPNSVQVKIECMNACSELCIVETKNDRKYQPKLFTAEECLTEQFGKGTLRETSTRDVRTIFDKNNMTESNLVLGEVINYPGKWSSYPPHGHNQPEIYYYRFLPEQGFGFSMDGLDTAHIINNGDALIILNGAPHSQTSAPGYAMYYIWAIRHLDGDPYGPDEPRKFIPEHIWVMDPKNNSKIWPPEE
jgi:5-deoxy-glucuronate isomerase